MSDVDNVQLEHLYYIVCVDKDANDSEQEQLWIIVNTIVSGVLAKNRMTHCSRASCDDIEDMVMSITIHIIEQMFNGKWQSKKGKCFAWVYTVARNSMLNILKKLSREQNKVSSIEQQLPPLLNCDD